MDAGGDGSVVLNVAFLVGIVGVDGVGESREFGMQMRQN